MPVPPEDWDEQRGAVLLIDEIDKADADLPNGLLETLGNGAFTVPYRKQSVGLGKGVASPLVVITTNAERELPPAFVRRCLVLNLEVPKTESAFIAWLLERAAAHTALDCVQEVREVAAQQLWGDRQKAKERGVSKPGLAEYIDLLRALTRLAPGKPALQRQWLAKIAGFTFDKHPDEDA
jgi:MoxR-like ATPase